MKSAQSCVKYIRMEINKKKLHCKRHIRRIRNNALPMLYVRSTVEEEQWNIDRKQEDGLQNPHQSDLDMQMWCGITHLFRNDQSFQNK